MSQQFPTHKQFIAQTRARLRSEYPDAAQKERELLEDCVALNTDEGAWLRHLGDLIKGGVKGELQVLDTLTDRQLDALKSVYAPYESLSWYVPAEHRLYGGTDPKDQRITPEKLFAYATKFCKRAENAGRGSQFPTFRQAAKHFRVSVKQVNDACQDWTGSGYMSAVVGFRTGSGISTIESQKDYQVEAYV